MNDGNINMTHYYGDQIRRIFMVSVVLMVIGLPFMLDVFALPLYIGIIAILILSYMAGLTSPKQPVIIWLNAIVSSAGFVVFEKYALELFAKNTIWLFIANQLLGILFLAAIYFSIKTIRALYNK